MPSKRNIQLVESLKNDVKSVTTIFLTDYKGLTVEELNSIRRKLEKVDAKYRVVKNTLFKIAIRDTIFQPFEEYLVGTNGAIFVKGDVIEACKVVTDALKDFENFKFKVGILEGKIINEDELKALSKLPPREVLYAQLLSVLLGPLTGLVTVLSGVPRNFLYVLKAIQEKKGGN